jgi:hypothetical protein
MILRAFRKMVFQFEANRQTVNTGNIATPKFNQLRACRLAVAPWPPYS